MADVPCSSSAPVVADQKKAMKLKLEANDGHIMEVDHNVAFKSKLLQKMISDLGITEADDKRLEEALPIPNVNGPTLEKIMVYCSKYKNVEYVPKDSNEDPRVILSLWDEEFLNVSHDVLTALLMGANYLDIPGLTDITTQKIANLAQNMTVEQLREFFNLKNDFTPEREEELRERFSWIDY